MKTTVGLKIKDLRKQKGITQEDLAEIASINVRTIQRIENNSNEPSGKTLRLICDALEVPIEELMEYNKTEDDSVLAILHLSVLAGLVMPLGNIILPLIIWITNKNKIKSAHIVGINIINFQIVYSLFTYTFMIMGILGKLMHNNFKIFISIAMSLYLINLILPIVFAILINKRDNKILYPKIIKLIK